MAVLIGRRCPACNLNAWHELFEVRGQSETPEVKLGTRERLHPERRDMAREGECVQKQLYVIRHLGLAEGPIEHVRRAVQPVEGADDRSFDFAVRADAPERDWRVADAD